MARSKRGSDTGAIRVLHVTWSLGIGGTERAVFQLVREQRRRGILADVVVASAAGIYGERLRESGVAVHQLRCRGAWDVRRSFRLIPIARRYPIVHLHAIEPLLIAAVARTDSALVYTHRGGVRNHGWVKRFRLAAARPLVRRFDAISANTEHSAIVVAKWLGIPVERVSVVYNGLEFALLEPMRTGGEVLSELPAPARSGMLVGTASKLQPLKRVAFLLMAVAGTSADVHCVILGDGPSRGCLERLASSLGIADRVTFLGRIEHVGDYLQLLDVFVLPSGPEEAFGNAAVEAMGVGIPTIVFADGGGLVEHIVNSETGLIVSDVEGLAMALEQLAANGTFRQDLGQRGMAEVRAKYTLEAMFERYARLYDEALAAKRRC